MNGELFRLHALQGAGLLGIAISRQIGCHARRNRLKRRVREAIRSIDLAPADGLDIAVTVKTAANEAGFQRLRDELQCLVTEMQARWADGSAST